MALNAKTDPNYVPKRINGKFAPIEAIQAMLDARAGDAAQVIEGEAEVVPSLPAPVAPKPAL
jgi:hypothetical protein